MSYDNQQELLATIRIPKNLLYLTERLPKPHYNRTVSKSKLVQSIIVKSNIKEDLIGNDHLKRLGSSSEIVPVDKIDTIQTE